MRNFSFTVYKQAVNLNVAYHSQLEANKYS